MLAKLKFWRYFHEIKESWNPEVSSHTIIHLWLANKKTSSNQRGPNGVTASRLGTSNARFFYIIWGLALRVLEGIQAEMTTLKCRMDTIDPKIHPVRMPIVIKRCWLNKISTKKYLFNFYPLAWSLKKNLPKIRTLFSKYCIYDNLLKKAT